MTDTKKLIIIVEDEPATAEMFAEMIRIMEYHPIKSLTGVQAISLIAEKKPVAVVLDWMLPDIDGIEVLQFMRRDADLARIPVVLVSAIGNSSDIKNGLEHGASIFLEKPVSFQDFKNALEIAIQGSIII